MSLALSPLSLSISLSLFLSDPVFHPVSDGLPPSVYMYLVSPHQPSDVINTTENVQLNLYDDGITVLD